MEAKVTVIDTASRGRVAFRSKLEARWALYFERMSMEWTYEPFRHDLGNGVTYTPDFDVKEIGIIEVKPTLAQVDESLDRIGVFLKQTARDRVYLLLADKSVYALSGDPVRVI